MMPAACEACKAISYFIEALETKSATGQVQVFPLNFSRQLSLYQPEDGVQNQCPPTEAEAVKTTHQTEMDKSSVHDVVLVGWSTRIPISAAVVAGLLQWEGALQEHQPW